MIRLLILLTSLLSLNLYSQDFKLFDWKSHVSFVSIKDAVIDEQENIWCASSGGILKYSVSDDSYQFFDNINGLSSVNYTAIEYIPSLKLIIAGNQEGYIDMIFDDGRIINIYDIVNSNIVNKTITGIKYINGIVYISGAFGVSEFNPNPEGSEFEQTFGDTYRLANVNSLKFYNNKIYIATEQKGVAYIELGKTISDPKNWNRIGLLNNEELTYAKDLIISNNNLYICDQKNIYIQESDTLRLIEESTYNINHLFIFNNNLYYDYTYGFKGLSNKDRFDFFGNDTISGSSHNRVIPFNDNLVLLMEFEGLGFVSNDKTLSIKTPKSSFSNTIFDMDIDSKNNLWITTGGRGFMKYDGQDWTYYNDFIKDVYGNSIPENNYRNISINKDDDVYVGRRGNGTGLLVIDTKNEEYKYKVYNDTNSAFVGTRPLDPPSYLEAAETQFDRNNVSWTINWADFYSGPVLIAKDGEQFYSYINCAGEDKRGFMHLAIDNEGTKWLGSDLSRDKEGLVLFNENGTLDDKSDDICMQLQTNNVPELANNTIRSIALDKNGWIWVGTPTGITYFLNPSGFLYDDDPRSLVAVSPNMFLEFDVNHIFVDEINYKWISTSKGIYVYNPDGTIEIAHITSENSPLPSNNVKNININKNTGEVFIATELGLYAAKSVSVMPSQNYDIICYPQPFNTKNNPTLTIEGLAGKSDIRITTVGGELIRKIDALGDKIHWDGKDYSGNFVKSGVYLILASSGVSNLQSVQKIAVINK
jgi:hypothetical protein